MASTARFNLTSGEWTTIATGPGRFILQRASMAGAVMTVGQVAPALDTPNCIALDPSTDGEDQEIVLVAGESIFARSISGETSVGVIALENTISVGGITRLLSASFTRPADTTAYLVGDLVANNVTPGSVAAMVFPVARRVNGSGAILRARLRKSGASINNASFRLHLYRTAPTVQSGDNGAWLTSGAMNYLGAIDVTCDRAFTDGAAGNGVPLAGSAINFDLAETGSQNVFGLLEARLPYVPVTGENFNVSLEVVQD